jgi:aldose sugar dehydrogenase
MRTTILTLATLLVGASLLLSQQNVPFQNGIPVAPQGLAGRKLPLKPVVYDTGEGQRIRVSVVTSKLENPFGMAFLPDGAILITERKATLRIVRNGVLDPKPIEGGPVGFGTGESGLPGALHGYMDVVLHPNFDQNHYVYITYTKPLSAQSNVAAISRSTWDGKRLNDTRDIFVSEGSGPMRLVFGKDNSLYVGISGSDPQALNTHHGKVLRLRDDGSIPTDNPFASNATAKREIFTLGHRNTLGLALHPATGDIWQNENGPNGGDEVNILRPGRNYGWPLVSLGRTYPGPWQGNGPTHAGYEAPLVYWTPAIAVSGMTFYTGDKFPKWKGDLFVASLRTGEIPGTGHIERVLFNEKMEELRRESLLVDLRQRMRDIRQSPDGFLYVLTDEKVGALLKVEPVK